jgi:hypothetical protein
MRTLDLYDFAERLGFNTYHWGEVRFPPPA